MAEVAARIPALRSRLDRVLGVRDGVATRLQSTETEIARLEKEEQLLDMVSNLFRTLIDTEVTEGVKAVEQLLTEGLQAVFDDQDLSVRSEVSIKKGKVSVDFITVQRHPDGSVTEGLSREAFGGAVTTVQSVLLRILVVLRRGMRPLLLLDESLPAFDPNYVHNMGRFIQLLCKRLQVDLLLVTHNPALVEASNVGYEIQKRGGAAQFRKTR